MTLYVAFAKCKLDHALWLLGSIGLTCIGDTLKKASLLCRIGSSSQQELTSVKATPGPLPRDLVLKLVFPFVSELGPHKEVQMPCS